MNTTEASSDRIPPEVWRIAFVIVFGAFMAGLDSSLVNVGLETITRSLNGSLAAAQWISSGYLIALAAALPACGWLGKRIGSARVWMAALAGFTIASLLCGVSSNISMLVLARILQGVAGGLLLPSGQAVLGRAAGPRHMGSVMNTAGVAVVLAPAIGPSIGGLMLAHLSWHWLFLVNLPIGATALILGASILPKEHHLAPAKLDAVGLVLLSVSIPALTYGVVQASREGESKAPILFAAVGMVVLLAYVVYALSRQEGAAAILDLSLYRNGAYTLAQTAIFFCGASLYGGLILFPLYFQLLRHESVVHTGFLLLAYGLGSAISLRPAGNMTDAVGGGLVASIGLVLAIVTTLPFAFLGANANMFLVEALQVIRGVGVSFAGLPVMSTVYALVRRDQLPDATVQANILQRIGGSFGSALIVVLLDRYPGKGLAAFQHVFLWLTLPAAVALLWTVLLWKEERH